MRLQWKWSAITIGVFALALGGCANMPAVPGMGGQSSSTAGSSSAGKQLADQSCTAPLGTVNIDEDTSQNWYNVLTAQYQLPSLIPVIRLLVQQSNCFVIVDRNAGLNHSLQERQLMQEGLLRANSNVHGNQIVAADYTIEPSITFSNSNVGAIAGTLGSFIPLPGAANIAGQLNMKSAQAVLTMVDNRSSVQLAAATGSAEGFDLGGFSTGTIHGKYASLGAYTTSPQGKVVLAAFIDAYNHLVVAVRNYKEQHVAGGLGTGGRLGVQGSGGAPAQSALSMLDAQRKLNSLGFHVGVPDGQYGPHTRLALTEFQRAHGLPTTGRLDSGTASLLAQQ